MEAKHTRKKVTDGMECFRAGLRYIFYTPTGIFYLFLGFCPLPPYCLPSNIIDGETVQSNNSCRIKKTFQVPYFTPEKIRNTLSEIFRGICKLPF